MKSDLDQIATNLNFLPASALVKTNSNQFPSAKIPLNRSAYLIRPTTIEQLARTVEVAHQHNWNILACGGGSKLDWGGVVEPVNLLVSTGQLNRIVDHAVGDLTVTVEAGVTLADLQQSLEPSKQFWPVDPAYPKTATIGGIVATADTGSWRQRYGGIRDLILGIEFVRADGQVAKAGGRVVKNVAGYDLMKLLTGSYGTLGIISQVTLRLYPIQAAAATVLLWGELESVAAAANSLRLSGLSPAKADWLSAGMLKTLGKTGEAGLVVSFESISESVEAQCVALAKIADGSSCSEIVKEAAANQLWQTLSEQIFADVISDSQTDSTGDRGQQTAAGNFTVVKIGVLPTAIPQLLSQLEPEDLVSINISTGVGKLRIMKSSRDKVSQIRAFAQQHRGYLNILESSIQLKETIDPWAISSQALPLMQRLKHQFDPQNLLNPGRMIRNN